MTHSYKSSARRRASATPKRTGTSQHRPLHHSVWWTAVPIVTVVLAVLTFVAIALGSGSGPGASPLRVGAALGISSGAAAAPAPVQRAVASVDRATLRAVGVPRGLTGPTRVSDDRMPLAGPDGKPEILYVGAEYCPYCAAERWALVVALSQFGSFSGLEETHSSSSDVYPDTSTLSFYGSTFSSPDLDFSSVELATDQAVAGRYPSLQELTPGQQSVLDTYDQAPYTSQAGAIPFIDVDNRFVMIGASYDPAVLQGKSVAQVASALSRPHSPIAQAVDGTANLIVAAISHATGVRPNR